MVSEQKQSAFKDWLRQQGGYVNPKVDLFHQLPSGDRGVYAAADIEEGEQLLLVPVSSTLHLDVTDARGIHLPATCSKELADFLTQQQQPAGTAAETAAAAAGGKKGQQRKPFSPFLATTLMLMSELSHGDDSSHAPYFNTLPEATTCLLNWTAEEQQLLAGTSLSDVTRSIQDIYESDIAPVLATRPDLFPPGRVSYESFRRAADMVQTRAFHMSADNWITGTHQESTDELYLIPSIDMLNHSTQPCLRNTSLALCHGEVEVTLIDGQTKTFTNFFSMRAEKAIPSGTQVLHTYGDLSDAQLLQTYGFIDITPQQQQQQEEEEGGDQHQQQQQRLSANPYNYVVLHTGELLACAKVVAAAAKIWPAKKAKQILAKRLQHLAAVGLLQQEQPESSQLMVTASNTLPDELLTIVQVLMMTESEFKQLQEAEQEEQQERAAAAAAAAGGSSQEQQQQQAVGLNLGRDMLEDEFGELCGAVLLQAMDRWASRYLHDLKASLAALQGSEPGSKPWLAAAVAVGEQQLLQQLKKEALMIMLGAAQGGEDEGEDDKLDSEEDLSENMSEDESADDVSGDEDDAAGDKQAKKAAAAAGSKKKRSRQEQEAAADAAQQSKQEHKHSSKHSSKHDSKHKHSGKHGDKHHHKKHKKGGKDDRPHFGDMTGPAEADVWQSDDSDKVGYSSSGSEDEGERHPVDPSEHHTYEVGAAGAVREAHGHMLGPDEAALLESDDSDKVGYADEGAAEAAAAAGGSGSKRGKQTVGTAAGGSSGGGSKKPKRGLGYKG